MLGLLIKDFLTLKRYAKTAAFLVIIYAFWGYLADNSTMLVAFLTIFFAMISVTSIAYDDAVHWNRYALTMPINRNLLVFSKYVLGLLLCLMGMVISLAGTLLLSAANQTTVNIEEILATMAVSAAIGVISISIYMPFALWLGVEKSRAIMIAIFLVPSILIGSFYKMAPEQTTDRLNGVFSTLDKNSTGTFLGLGLFIILMLLVSIAISIAIFKKKEF